MLETKLISLYYRICHYYSTQSSWRVQRLSPSSYQPFASRLNRLPACLPLLVECLLEELPEQEQEPLRLSLLDSMPVMTCSHKRGG